MRTQQDLIKLTHEQTTMLYLVSGDDAALNVMWLGIAAVHGMLTQHITAVKHLDDNIYELEYEPYVAEIEPTVEDGLFVSNLGKIVQEAMLLEDVVLPKYDNLLCK